MENHSNHHEWLQKQVAAYRAAGEAWPTDSKTIASWVARETNWKPSLKNIISLLAPEISKAMRDEYFTDPQGRRVRKKHAVLQKEVVNEDELASLDAAQRQRMLWVDIDDPTTTVRHMRSAFRLRRGQILGDCRQLKTDVDSFNQNFNRAASIRMLWDFTEDMAETSQHTTYVPPDLTAFEDSNASAKRVAQSPSAA